MTIAVLDSQCFTYLIDTIENIVAPTDSLARERIALVRGFFYAPIFNITETAVEEFKAIPDPDRRDRHNSWGLIHLNYFYNFHIQQAIADRTAELATHHSGFNDCRIVAESELNHADLIVCYDKTLARRLKDHAHIKFTTPDQYWQSLGIEKGSQPRMIPANSNPLSEQDWWRW